MESQPQIIAGLEHVAAGEQAQRLEPAPRAQAPDEPCSVDHVLSFDVEEYFHVEAAARFVSPSDWAGFPARVEQSVDQILEILAASGASATFFVLGEVARNCGPMVARIAAAGHEIASHGMSHKMLTRLSPREFRDELSDSRKLLEDLCGCALLGFRAPTFSVTRATGCWAIDTLVEAGFQYDSSVFPIRHDRYGVPDAPRWAHWAIGSGGSRILEAPPLTLRTLGMNLPVGGGGYLRLLPLGFINRGLNCARSSGRAGVIYMHPWELDPDQPVVPMTRLSRWRHRVNLTRTARKLRRILACHRLGSFRQALAAMRSSARDEYRFAHPEH